MVFFTNAKSVDEVDLPFIKGWLEELESNSSSGKAKPSETGLKISNSSNRTNNKPKGEGLLWLAQALLLVRDHPDWSDAEIARQVGKNKSTLSRNETYQEAARLARGVKGDLAKGYQTTEGNEAYSDDPVERDWED